MKRQLLYIFSVFLLLNSQETGKAADLQEAYEIAHVEAVKWNELARPYFITSVDDSLESDTVKGADGKRSYWNFDFVIEGTNRHLIITLHNKTVVNKTEAESVVCSDHIINMDDCRICTAAAVTVAKEVYALRPGTDWAQGYHFVLENTGSVLMLSVVGLDKDGEMSRVFFDAKTGQVIGRSNAAPSLS